MIDHVWTVLCSKSIIDKDSNSISLLEVIEQITGRGVKGEAVVPIPMELVSLWARTDPEKPARGRARVCLIEPDGSERDPFEIDIDLMTYQRSRTRFQMSGLPIRLAGRYYFRIEIHTQGEEGWGEVSRIPLEVVLQGSSQ